MKNIHWGTKKWYEIHTKTMDYPKKPNELEKEEMRKYIIELYKNVSCGYCKRETKEYITKYESQMNEICSSRDNVFKFFVDFHNHVNEKLNKPKVSYIQAHIFYQINKIYRNFNNSK
jgi:hypothetical protein